MRLTKGGEADAAATAAAAVAADQEKWFWHADSKPVCLSLLPFPLLLPRLSSPTLVHPLTPRPSPFLRPYARCFVLACELARTEIHDVSRV